MTHLPNHAKMFDSIVNIVRLNNHPCILTIFLKVPWTLVRKPERPWPGLHIKKFMIRRTRRLSCVMYHVYRTTIVVKKFCYIFCSFLRKSSSYILIFFICIERTTGTKKCHLLQILLVFTCDKNTVTILVSKYWPRPLH